MKHYTIICEPKDFDQKFKEFVEKENPSRIEITHQGHIHYILYTERIPFEYEDDDEFGV